jgi:hypothetical protein
MLGQVGAERHGVLGQDQVLVLGGGARQVQGGEDRVGVGGDQLEGLEPLALAGQHGRHLLAIGGGPGRAELGDRDDRHVAHDRRRRWRLGRGIDALGGGRGRLVGRRGRCGRGDVQAGGWRGRRGLVAAESPASDGHQGGHDDEPTDEHQGEPFHRRHSATGLRRPPPPGQRNAPSGRADGA